MNDMKLFWIFMLVDMLLCALYICDYGWTDKCRFEIGFHLVLVALIGLPFVIGEIAKEKIEASVEQQENHTKREDNEK